MVIFNSYIYIYVKLPEGTWLYTWRFYRQTQSVSRWHFAVRLLLLINDHCCLLRFFKKSCITLLTSQKNRPHGMGSHGSTSHGSQVQKLWKWMRFASTAPLAPAAAACSGSRPWLWPCRWRCRGPGEWNSQLWRCDIQDWIEFNCWYGWYWFMICWSCW